MEIRVISDDVCASGRIIVIAAISAAAQEGVAEAKVVSSANGTTALEKVSGAHVAIPTTGGGPVVARGMSTTSVTARRACSKLSSFMA